MNIPGVTVKEHPILFSGTMVKAILSGEKTQTRRWIKPQPSEAGLIYVEDRDPDGSLSGFAAWVDELLTVDEGRYRICPHGVPGDRLWVKETFWHGSIFTEPYYPGEYVMGEFIEAPCGDQRVEPYFGEWTQPGSPIADYSGNAMDYIKYCAVDKKPIDDKYPYGIRWGKRPSIHMPRWASRILLEITDVRVERVQDISYQDAIAEGFGLAGAPIEAFHALWDSIYKARGAGWDANPFVWVIEFKKL